MLRMLLKPEYSVKICKIFIVLFVKYCNLINVIKTIPIFYVNSLCDY